jgi:integrase
MDADISTLRARLESAVAVDAPAKPSRLTITILATLYLAHAAKKYNGRHGCKELNIIKNAMAPLLMLYGELHPSQLRPLHLRAARQWWIEKHLARTTIQQRMQRLRHVWRWARSVELIDTDLPDIEAVRFGHAKETADVEPVDLALFEATLPHVSPIVGIMLRVQLLTGARPGEICDLRGVDLDMKREVWVYRPAIHKTRWLDHRREIFIGPRARVLIQPYLNPSYLFLTKSRRPFNSGMLHRAVWGACEKHDLPHWAPNMLRHTAATMIREKFGLDSAQAVLGHARIETSQVYAARMDQLASTVAAAVG